MSPGASECSFAIDADTSTRRRRRPRESAGQRAAPQRPLAHARVGEARGIVREQRDHAAAIIDLRDVLSGGDRDSGNGAHLADDLVAHGGGGPPAAHERRVDDKIRLEARAELRDQRALEAPAEDAEEEHRAEPEPEGRDGQRRPTGLVAHLRGGETSHRTEEQPEHHAEHAAAVHHQRRRQRDDREDEQDRDEASEPRDLPELLGDGEGERRQHRGARQQQARPCPAAPSRARAGARRPAGSARGGGRKHGGEDRGEDTHDHAERDSGELQRPARRRNRLAEVECGGRR
jgi:hypothetical protein